LGGKISEGQWSEPTSFVPQFPEKVLAVSGPIMSV